jgi:hypothetical protein
MSESEEEEFFHDFGARPLTDAELDALLANARNTGDATLRQLVKQLRTLRWAADALLRRVESTEATDVPDSDPQMKLIRFLVRGQ